MAPWPVLLSGILRRTSSNLSLRSMPAALQLPTRKYTVAARSAASYLLQNRKFFRPNASGLIDSILHKVVFDAEPAVVDIPAESRQ